MPYLFIATAVGIDEVTQFVQFFKGGGHCPLKIFLFFFLSLR